MSLDLHTDAGGHRLRLLFGGSVVSHTVAPGATYGDIARLFNETTRMRHGNPISAAVTLGGDMPPAVVRPPNDWDVAGIY